MTWDFDIWTVVGIVGQLLFTARFVVQWIESERQKKSVVPVLFWYLSIGGSAIILIYAIRRKDIVFTLGQSFGLFVYLRNLYFISQTSKQQDANVQ